MFEITFPHLAAAGVFVLIALAVLAMVFIDRRRGNNPPRLAGTIVATLFLLAAIALLAPHELTVSLYKISLVSMAGVVGYWLDREIFPYARPDSFIDCSAAAEPEPAPADQDHDQLLIGSGLLTDHLFAASMIRRAIIVGCAMLAIGLGA